MNRDLDEQLNEMGPEYRAVVARLRGGREAGTPPGSRVFRLVPYLTAASILAAVGFGVLFLGLGDVRRETRDTGFGAREYRASVDEMIATQNPDGSWQNDFLTRRNASALRASVSADARVAYKKAMRNLRARGLL